MENKTKELANEAIECFKKMIEHSNYVCHSSEYSDSFRRSDDSNGYLEKLCAELSIHLYQEKLKSCKETNVIVFMNFFHEEPNPEYNQIKEVIDYLKTILK